PGPRRPAGGAAPPARSRRRSRSRPRPPCRAPGPAGRSARRAGGRRPRPAGCGSPPPGPRPTPAGAHRPRPPSLITSSTLTRSGTPPGGRPDEQSVVAAPRPGAPAVLRARRRRTTTVTAAPPAEAGHMADALDLRNFLICSVHTTGRRLRDLRCLLAHGGCRAPVAAAPEGRGPGERPGAGPLHPGRQPPVVRRQLRAVARRRPPGRLPDPGGVLRAPRSRRP